MWVDGSVCEREGVKEGGRKDRTQGGKAGGNIQNIAACTKYTSRPLLKMPKKNILMKA